MSVAGVHDVPFHFRISLLAGAIVETDFPCNATTVSEVDPVASPVCTECENVFDDKARPVPAEYELLLSVAGVHAVPFHFKTSLLAGAIVETDDPFNWFAFQIAEVLFAEKVLPTKEIPVPGVYELLLSAEGHHDVPFHFRISLLAGAIVETDFPCNATTVSEVDPVASPVWAVCEKLLEFKVIPTPSEYELPVSAAGVHAVPFHFRISLFAGAVVDIKEPFN